MGRKERAKERREKRLQEISLLRTIPYSDHQRWWSSETIAVVTGANRGIGFEIVRQLAGHGLTVVLTSRENGAGLEAVNVLVESGLSVVYHQLDITSSSSINEFTDWIQQNYGAIDILVNNAGVNYNTGADNSVEYSRKVIETNYYGTKSIIKAIIPFMRQSAAGARIVNVSSRLGRINGRRNRLEDATLKEQFSNVETLSEELVDRTMSTFLEQVEEGTWESGGWPQVFTDYSMSKMAVNCFTRIMAKELLDRPDGQKIYINSYCPGWVKTAMTGWAGNISTADAADTGVWLALLPDLSISGKFFAERREISF
ncbi:NAD(P)-binding Rossmann-fold superfamily protein [Euphorbia peplus]|nr:NAD(P)-binding Rossmann-fold superfamily protein [Euphorbia peplus]